MKKRTIFYLIATLITGIVGFIGIGFTGIEVVRILFLIFADLLIISVLARFMFSDSENMRLERIRK